MLRKIITICLLFLFVFTGCELQNSHPTTKGGSQTPSKSQEYIDSINLFSSEAQKFTPEFSQMGHEIYDIFTNCGEYLFEMLEFRESLDSLKSDLDQVLGNDNGFYIKLSDTFTFDTINYRLIEFSSTVEAIGATNTLFLQCWDGTRVEVVTLYSFGDTATEDFGFIGYDILNENDTPIVIITHKREENEWGSDSYYLSAYSISDMKATPYVPIAESISYRRWVIEPIEWRMYMPKETILDQALVYYQPIDEEERTLQKTTAELEENLFKIIFSGEPHDELNLVFTEGYWIVSDLQ